MKKLTALLAALACMFTLAACNEKSMDKIIASEPSITGTVTDTQEGSILIENGDGEYWVSLDVENQDSMTHFTVGDEVVVYFDGTIAETYPMQISKVYAITLKTPADREAQSEVAQFLNEKYGMQFKLWCPDGHDLYKFHIFPDYAERECHIMMGENSDDVAQYHKDLSWEIVDDELIISGAWEETFRIDMAAGTATSTSTGKVYTIYEME